jgi:hypothetical protein
LPFGLLGWDREGMEVKVVGAAGVGIGPILYVCLVEGRLKADEKYMGIEPIIGFLLYKTA